jgi:two-component system, NtrC family, response regulator AtoC
MHDSDIVLVVDDDAQVRSLIARFLALDGVKSEPAATADDALERVTRGDISLVLIDLKLHGDENAGLDLLAQLRGLDSALPLMIVSAYPDIAEFHPGVDVVVKHPEGIDGRELVLKVKKALRDRCRDIKVNETHEMTREVHKLLIQHLEDCKKDRDRLKVLEDRPKTLGDLLLCEAKNPIVWGLVTLVLGFVGLIVKLAERKIP